MPSLLCYVILKVCFQIISPSLSWRMHELFIIDWMMKETVISNKTVCACYFQMKLILVYLLGMDNVYL